MGWAWVDAAPDRLAYSSLRDTRNCVIYLLAHACKTQPDLPPSETSRVHRADGLSRSNEAAGLHELGLGNNN